MIVGRIQLEDSGDPEYVRSQLMIFDEGFLSVLASDLLNRPIAFRIPDYRGTHG